MKPVVKQNWMEDEYEPGWGRSTRNDGDSLHLTEADRKRYCDKAVKRDREENAKIKNGYSLHYAPSGQPTVIDVDDKTYKAIRQANGSLRRSKEVVATWEAHQKSAKKS